MAVKEKIGVIVSDKMDSTRIIAVIEQVVHKKYKKVLKRTKRFAVHDPRFNSNFGDQVRIRKTIPLSKTKKWILISILIKS